MAFCTQCGNQVGPTDRYCAKCGAVQTPVPPPPRTPVADDILKDVSARTVSLLCYIPFVGWVASIVILASPRFQKDRVVRFHAFQGIYLFVVWLLVDWVIAPMFTMMPGRGPSRAIAGLLHASVLFAWIFMIIKTSQEQLFRLPIIGELAERSVAEQR